MPSLRRIKLLGTLAFAFVLGSSACDGDGGEEGAACGPTSGVVARIVDGDTIELESGEKIRYLMIDTPESTNGAMDCWGEESKQFNTNLVLGKEVSIRYDVECTDRYGRLLAYIDVGDREVNSYMVEQGQACVLHISPNGDDRVDEFNDLELVAKTLGKGLWGSCDPVTCD